MVEAPRFFAFITLTSCGNLPSDVSIGKSVIANKESLACRVTNVQLRLRMYSARFQSIKVNRVYISSLEN